MNKTENKTQSNFANIKEIQNLIEHNNVGNLAVSLKAFRQKLNAVGAKIVEIKKAASAKVVEKPKTEPTPIETKKVEPAVQEKPVAPAKPAAPDQRCRGSDPMCGKSNARPARRSPLFRGAA